MTAMIEEKDTNGLALVAIHEDVKRLHGRVDKVEEKCDGLKTELHDLNATSLVTSSHVGRLVEQLDRDRSATVDHRRRRALQLMAVVGAVVAAIAGAAGASLLGGCV